MVTLKLKWILMGAFLAASVSHHTRDGRSGLHVSVFITKGKLKLGWGPRALLGSLDTSMEPLNLPTSPN